ncbi:hypothetical protein [Paraburkholderia largidicola]|uniref:hypothetical protein n=1 Tax=Paraburkholderia largidicola TaxID=3014751 RepID=UPI0015DA53BA|nr:hypothetical protein [Paraburkholderia sp. PGU16]
MDQSVAINNSKTMKLPIVCVLSTLLVAGCQTVSRPIRGQDPLSAIPADPHQITSPHWVTADNAKPNPYLPKEMAGDAWMIDVSSIRSEYGWIWVWERFIPSPGMAAAIGIQVADTYRGFNCETRETTERLHRYRKIDGTLIREGEANGDWDLHKTPAGTAGPKSREIDIVCQRQQRSPT